MKDYSPFMIGMSLNSLDFGLLIIPLNLPT